MPKALIIDGTSEPACRLVAQLTRLDYEILLTCKDGTERALRMSTEHRDCELVMLDNSNTDDVINFLDNLDDDYAPDLLINFAGTMVYEAPSWDSGDRLIHLSNVHFVSPAMITANIAGRMARHTGGSIINIISNAETGRIGRRVWESTNLAFERLNNVLAEEVAAFNVRIFPVSSLRRTLSPAPLPCEQGDIHSRDTRGRVLNPHDLENAVMSCVKDQLASAGVARLGSGRQQPTAYSD